MAKAFSISASRTVIRTPAWAKDQQVVEHNEKKETKEVGERLASCHVWRDRLEAR